MAWCRKGITYTNDDHIQCYIYASTGLDHQMHFISFLLIAESTTTVGIITWAPRCELFNLFSDSLSTWCISSVLQYISSNMCTCLNCAMFLWLYCQFSADSFVLFAHIFQGFSLILRSCYDCPSVSEIAVGNMGWSELVHNFNEINQVWTVCIFREMCVIHIICRYFGFRNRYLGQG